MPRRRVIIDGRRRSRRVTGRIEGTTLDWSDGDEVQLDEATLDDVAVGPARLASFVARKSRVTNSRFLAVKVKGGSLGINAWPAPRVRYESVLFDRCDFRRVEPGNVTFVGCEFRDCALEGWIAHHADFVGCTFVGRVSDVKFFGRHDFDDLCGKLGAEIDEMLGDPAFTDNRFEDNDFTRAVLSDFAFLSGIDVERQRLPDGPEYVRFDRVADRIARTSSVVSSWQGEERVVAEVLLGLMDDEPLPPTSFRERYLPGHPHSAADRFWNVFLAKL